MIFKKLPFRGKKKIAIYLYVHVCVSYEGGAELVLLEQSQSVLPAGSISAVVV